MATIWERIRAALEPETRVPAEVEHHLRLAICALLLEMCRADFKELSAERLSIAAGLQRHFELSTEEVREVLRLAEVEADCAASLQIYTSLINEYSTSAQKRSLLHDLWRVAYADGELHILEENLVARVAELLDIPARENRAIGKQALSESRDTGKDAAGVPDAAS